MLDLFILLLFIYSVLVFLNTIYKHHWMNLPKREKSVWDEIITPLFCSRYKVLTIGLPPWLSSTETRCWSDEGWVLQWMVYSPSHRGQTETSLLALLWSADQNSLMDRVQVCVVKCVCPAPDHDRSSEQCIHRLSYTHFYECSFCLYHNNICQLWLEQQNFV